MCFLRASSDLSFVGGGGGRDVNQIISKSSPQQTIEKRWEKWQQGAFVYFLMEKSEFKDHEYEFCDKTKWVAKAVLF